MNPLYEAAKEVYGFMSARKWKCCIIGGLANSRWGEQRRTVDVDLTLLTGFGSEEQFAQPLLRKFKGRRPDALKFALAHRVLLLSASNGVPVDISFGALQFEEQMLKRASSFEFAPGLFLPTCSAEDLFVMKTFAARPRDWLDAEGIAARQKGKLDVRYVLKHLRALCELKEAPEIVDRARKVLKVR